MWILFVKKGWIVSNGLLCGKKKRIPNLFSISFIKKAGAEGQNRIVDTGIFRTHFPKLPDHYKKLLSNYDHNESVSEHY